MVRLRLTYVAQSPARSLCAGKRWWQKLTPALLPAFPPEGVLVQRLLLLQLKCAATNTYRDTLDDAIQPPHDHQMARGTDNCRGAATGNVQQVGCDVEGQATTSKGQMTTHTGPDGGVERAGLSWDEHTAQLLAV